jgi:hypothetical protein
VDDASVTRSGSVAGTPQYMAPEQARGEAVDQRADLFALGSTLYAMCTGQAPFRGDSGVAVIRQVCDVEPRPIRAIDPEVPAWLEGVVRKLHAKEPANRFQSAAEVAELLERCLAHVQHPDRHPLPTLAAELGRQVPDLRPRKPSRRRPAAAVAVALAALCGAGLFSLGRYTQPPAGDVDPPESRHANSDKPPAPRADTPHGGGIPAWPAGERDERFDALRSRVEALRHSFTDAGEDTGGGQGFDGLWSDLGALRHSFTDDGKDAEGATDASLAEAKRRADQLGRELTPGADPGSDPVKSQIELIRARLEALRQQMGVRP